MADNQQSAISDPRASLQNYSNRQDSSFQYGDPPKYQIDVNILDIISRFFIISTFRIQQNLQVIIQKKMNS